MSEGIPVDEWLSKAEGKKDPTVKPSRPDGEDKKTRKVVLVVSSASGEDSAVGWVADALKEQIGAEAELAVYHLPAMKVSPCSGCYAGGGRVCSGTCDRNDVESDIFSAADQMPVLIEKMEESDALLLVSDVRAGALNHVAQRYLERLHPLLVAKNGHLAGKWFGGFFIGPSAQSVACLVAGALGEIGYVSGRGGVGSWALPHEVPQDSVKSIFQKSDALKATIKRVASAAIDAINE